MLPKANIFDSIAQSFNSQFSKRVSNKTFDCFVVVVVRVVVA